MLRRAWICNRSVTASAVADRASQKRRHIIVLGALLTGEVWELHEPRVKNERAYRLPHNQYRCAEEVARTKHRCEPVGSV